MEMSFAIWHWLIVLAIVGLPLLVLLVVFRVVGRRGSKTTQGRTDKGPW